MRCNVCGADNLEGAAYCEDCGARLPMAAAQPTQEVPVAAPLPPPIPVAPAPTVTAVSEPPAAGVSVGGVVVCPACGAHNPPGVAFCEDCGASLSDTSPSLPGPGSPPVNYDASPAAATMGAVASSRPRLVHTSGKEFALDKDTILLGRRSPVDGIFPEVDLTDYDSDSYISRRHGRITRGPQGYVYEDLGSSNGSWVNGQKMQPHVQQPLSEGGSLRLGKTEMVVRLV